MATNKQKPRLVVIVGPTASGKSNLAMQIARQFNGEIICADSRTIYKDMNIGTAKPSVKDRAEVKHWGLDIVKPGQAYSAKQFKDYALEAIKDIVSRNKLPVVVGGTGLYVDALIFDYQFLDKADPRAREELESQSIEQLQNSIKELAINMPTNYQNKRHLIRVIETKGEAGARQNKPFEGALLIGMNPGIEAIELNIKTRISEAFNNGLVDETRMLVDKYGKTEFIKTAGIIYLTCIDYMAGKITTDQAKNFGYIAERQYAKRQLTWFKRNSHIHWFSDKVEAAEYIKKSLNN